jgi:PAS domain S-box-containing protein
LPRNFLGQVGAPLAVATVYLLAAQLGELLAIPSAPVSALWAPNAIVMAALLLTPRHRWWVYLLAILPLHLAAQLPYFPFARVAVQYLANCSLAVLGAIAVQSFSVAPLSFSRVRTAFTLILFGGLLAPLVTSMGLAAAFALFGISNEFWLTVVVRTLTNAFAVVALVPLIVNAVTRVRKGPVHMTLSRSAEAAMLGVPFVTLCVLVFAMPLGSPDHTSLLLYAPLPLLTWAAMRFGVSGACSAALLVGAVSTYGMVNGFGPFTGRTPLENALGVVSFNVIVCCTVVAFAALLEEWRNAGRALVVSRARFRSIFENNIIPTAIWRDDLRISEANDAFMRLTGFSWADIEGGKLRFDQLASWTGMTGTQAIHSSELFGKLDRSEHELALSDGRRVPVILGHCRFPADEGGVIYVLDLSAFRRAEAQRMKAETLHSAVLASLHDQIAVIDSAGVVVEVNDSWQRAVDSAHSSRFDRVAAGDNVLETCARAAERGERGAVEQLRALRTVLDGTGVRCQLEYREAAVDEPAWIEVSIERLRRADGGAIITRTDVTARKRAEIEARNQRQQVTHLARAAVLGQLSGAFAHELNQPLTSILGNAEAALSMIEKGTESTAELSEILHDIVQDDERAAQVIQRLRALLGKGETERKPVDVNAMVRDSLDLTHSECVSRNVHVSTEFDSELPLVMGDRIQMQQVVLNLVMNACESIAGTASNARQINVRTSLLASEAAVEIVVRDSGGGIPEGDLERIFQPFVTTKPNGLGLGLAICRSVAESHRGKLWARNAPETGAELHMKLPIDRGLP